MDDHELHLRFPNLRPIESPPSVRTVAGIGTMLYGGRDFDEETRTYVKTRGFCVLGIPLIALGAYRVADEPGGWNFLGREPLSTVARAWNFAFFCLALGLGSYWGWDRYTGSPDYQAGRAMAAAEQESAAGHVGRAAGLYRDVALGTTSHAAEARRLMVALLEVSTRQAPAAEGVEVVRAAADLRQQSSQAAAVAEPAIARAVELAGRLANSDPATGVAVLDAVAPFAGDDARVSGARRRLLEGWVKRSPADPEPASQLAVLYEGQGGAARCEKLLAPHASRLGDREGARILGHLRASAGNYDQACALLQPYVDSHLAKLHEAERQRHEAIESTQKRALEQLKGGHALDFNYERYESANEAEKLQMLQVYCAPRTRSDATVRKASEAMLAESRAVPAAVDLGIARLHRAQTLTDPKARRHELEQAEKTFLAVQSIAGETAQYRMNLGQVYYWLGRHAEGRKLLHEAVESAGWQTQTALHVARLLRQVGEDSEARAMIEQAYQKATNPRLKYEAAAERGILALDNDDKLTWLNRADPADDFVQAELHSTRGFLALTKGNEEEASGQLREAVATYDRMPESAASLNNSAMAQSALFYINGDRADLDDHARRLEKAVNLAPSDSLLVLNAASALLEAGMTDMAGESLDFKILRQAGSESLLAYLCADEAAWRKMGERVMKHPPVLRARTDYERLLVLSPKRPEVYSKLSALYALVDDESSLRGIERRLSSVELDVADDIRENRDLYAGRKDAKRREEFAAAQKHESDILRAARSKGGATLAVAASQLAASRLGGDTFGIRADADEVVRLAEEAHRAAPSAVTSAYLVEALAFRASRALAQLQPEYGRRAARAARALRPAEILTAAVVTDSTLTTAALANSDFQRIVVLLLEHHRLFPRQPSPWNWALLQAAGRSEAEQLARAIRADTISNLERSIRRRTSPLDATGALNDYWIHRLLGQEAEGRKELKRLAGQGMPLPVELK